MKGLRAIAWGSLICVCANVSQLQAAKLKLGFGTNKPPYVYEFESRGLEFDLVAAALREAGDEMTPYYAPMERLHLMLKRGEFMFAGIGQRQGGVDGLLKCCRK